MNKLKVKFKELQSHPFFGFIIFGVLLLLIPIFSKYISVTVIDAFAKTLIYFIVALGFSILMGYAGLASLGTSSFIAIGTFTLYSGMTYFNLGFFLTLLIALIIALALGVLFGIVSLRIEGMN